MESNRVVIVGKPNVGKSTLFNKISGKRKSIVHNLPGVTRDVIEEEAEWKNKKFIVVDTGGIVPEEKDWFLQKIREKVINELERAGVILFMTDGREGITSTDEEISKLLQRYREKVILVVNKIDRDPDYKVLSEYYRLGFEPLVPVSAQHGKGVAELLDIITGRIGTEDGEKKEYIKISFIGRPNTGKSSLINALLKEERVIVSPEAGTTRDAVDIPFNWKGNDFLLVDTAGIRRPSRVEYGVEFFAVGRSLDSIERSDIVCLVIDCTEGVTKQDKRLSGLIERKKKGLIIVVNKKDLCNGSYEELTKYIRKELFFVEYAPIVYVSALKGENVEHILSSAVEVYNDYTKKLKTSAVNNAIRKILREKKPPVYKNKEVKVFFAFQKAVKPPTFVLITNYREGWKQNYLKFFERKFREYTKILNSPLKFIIEERRD